MLLRLLQFAPPPLLYPSPTVLAAVILIVFRLVFKGVCIICIPSSSEHPLTNILVCCNFWAISYIYIVLVYFFVRVFKFRVLNVLPRFPSLPQSIFLSHSSFATHASPSLLAFSNSSYHFGNIWKQFWISLGVNLEQFRQVLNKCWKHLEQLWSSFGTVVQQSGNSFARRSKHPLTVILALT